MKLIFSNDCTAGNYYSKVINKELPHPLCYSLISHKQFIRFVNNYDNINWNNCYFFNNNVVIDNCFTCDYIHYNSEETQTHYLTRINRLKDITEPPIFVYNQTMFDTRDTINDVLNKINTHYRVILIIERNINYTNIPSNIEIIHKDNTYIITHEIAKFINNYLNERN